MLYFCSEHDNLEMIFIAQAGLIYRVPMCGGSGPDRKHSSGLAFIGKHQSNLKIFPMT